jgi:malate dehydrogenase (oxaloacetate-decarboxylating)
MTKYVIDTTLRLRIPHRPGQLARFAAAIAAEGALMGEIATVRVAGTDTVRDITVETSDEEHTARVIEAVRRLDGIELIQTTDRVFDTHRGGKIRTASRVPVEQLRDLRYVYTPGVARVATAIHREPERAWELTGIGHSVGIFTNGSRVLGLGNIGPLASLPVMEGKAVLYDKFAGISATPVLVDTLDADEFIETVVRLAPTFGAIHLEDIRIPECYRIEQELDRRLAKPVMHDDQWGTATAALAALLNACRTAGRDLKTARVGQIGLGAAGSAIALLALAYGVRDVMVTDLSAEAVARMQAAGARPVDFPTLLRDADIVIATTGKPDLIRPAMVRTGQVIFALSNPDPEMRPEDAMAAGAAFAADGRSINNALAYPGLFKGALEVRSRAITKPMLLAAAEAIADHAEPGEVVPNPLSPRVHDAVRQAVVACARAEGLENTARLTAS